MNSWDRATLATILELLDRNAVDTFEAKRRVESCGYPVDGWTKDEIVKTVRRLLTPHKP